MLSGSDPDSISVPVWERNDRQAHVLKLRFWLPQENFPNPTHKRVDVKIDISSLTRRVMKNGATSKGAWRVRALRQSILQATLTEQIAMANDPILSDSKAEPVRDSWVPMIVIAMGQMLLSFNVSALPVSMGGMVQSFDVPPTTIATAIVLYSLCVSAFILPGAKIGQRFGARRLFQVNVLIFGAAMALMSFSPGAETMFAAQGIAGVACAALVPTLVVLVATHYHGRQQAEAFGWLGAAGASASVFAFLAGGAIATFLTWRVTFGLFIFHAAAVLLLSARLMPTKPKPEVKIDGIGAALSATAIVLVAFALNNVLVWGVLLAGPGTPFDLLGVSPVPVMVIIGIMMGAAFFFWTHHRVAAGKAPLLALQVVDSPREWAAVVAVVAIGGIEAAINFAVPLYIQIIQGRSGLETSLAIMPLMLAVFFSAILVVRLYERFSPRQLASCAFALIFAGTLWLAFVAANDWSVLPVILGLITVGVGQGALMTLILNVLVSESPKELASDVGSLRGVTQNLAAAVGTALMAALLVGLLSSLIMEKLIENPVIQAEFIDAELAKEFDLDNVNFVSNQQLVERLAQTTATPEKVEEALRINSETRLRSLKIGFLALSSVALLAILPCQWLPDYRPDEILET